MSEMQEYKIKRYEAALNSLADRHGGELTAELVLSEARKQRSPLHDAFEWDDTKAAEGFRLDQARHLIRACYIVVRDEVAPEKTVRVRSFHHVDGAYRRTEDVLRRDEWKRELLNRLAKEVAMLRARYQNIASLQTAYASIDSKLAEAEALAQAS